jgi:hypothetical protein
MDLTLTDAWALWWSGQQLTDHTLHGAPVLWLGRAGKMLAFLAGCTIVLDIIGSERITSWGSALQQKKVVIGLTAVGCSLYACSEILSLLGTAPMIEEAWPWVGGFWVGVAFNLGVAAALAVVLFWVPTFITGFGRLLAWPWFEWWLRRIAVLLFFLGFALDYLAS